MNPALPKRILGGHWQKHGEMPVKRALVKSKWRRFFGHPGERNGEEAREESMKLVAMTYGSEETLGQWQRSVAR